MYLDLWAELFPLREEAAKVTALACSPERLLRFPLKSGFRDARWEGGRETRVGSEGYGSGEQTEGLTGGHSSGHGEEGTLLGGGVHRTQCWPLKSLCPWLRPLPV